MNTLDPPRSGFNFHDAVSLKNTVKLYVSSIKIRMYIMMMSSLIAQLIHSAVYKLWQHAREVVLLGALFIFI